MPLTITASELKRFAPQAKEVYVEALLANLDVLEEAGILETNLRLAHFMGQCAAETGGFVVLRESMAYRPARLRQVWPSRFAHTPEGALAALCADPIKLCDAVYGGRMGNRKGTSDGYDFRGGGFLQTTGRYSVEKYCKQLGVEATRETLDDIPLCLKMACFEWQRSGCNEWADKNDVLRVSKAINTGSAMSNVAPVGMPDRKIWLAKAIRVWGNAQPVERVAAAEIAEPSHAEQHAEAHDALKEASAFYNANSMTIKGLGLSAGTAIAFLREHAFEIALVALVVIAAFELMRYAQRASLMKKGG